MSGVQMGVEGGLKALESAFADAVEIVRRDGSALPKTLPIHATLEGAPVVILAAAEYRRLLSSAFDGPAKGLRAMPRRPGRRAPLPSTVERDAEVAGFLRTRLAQAATIAAAHAACLESFGPGRTPSPSRIDRFRTKMREGA